MVIPASGRQLRPDDTEADGEADAEDDSVDEVTTENIRPRPQGSSPVYEYCIEDEYFNKKFQQDLENRQRRASSIKMSDSQESMEVTLHTEIESGASGFSVAGGGNEGIFVKKVLKESPASKLFSLREGDQLLSATIFFDNIKYEDALKILQYSEPYKVQFSLKRKFNGKEDLETIHSSMLSKKEKLSQGKETQELSEKTITEEDKANLIVKQRVGRQKRPKKDRLSWPKFQSITGKKILGHRRSRSTSDAYEHAIPDVSPTSTDTEFLPEEIHAKVKKGSQKKLKFPSIGFKMYRSKQETEEKSKLEGKAWTEYEYSATGEHSETITVEDSSSSVKDNKTREQFDTKKNIKEPKYELISHAKKCPEVEITIKKSKEKKQKSRAATKPESTIITSQITSGLEIEDSSTKQTSFPKIRKKKQKGSQEKIQSKTTVDYEKKEIEMDIKDGTAGIQYQLKQHTEITELPDDINIEQRKISLDLQAPAVETETPSAEMTIEGTHSKLEGGDTRFKMPRFQMPTFGISLPKGKAAVEGEITVPSIEAEIPTAELKGEVTVPSLETGIKVSGPQIEAPSMQVEVGEKGKIKMPDVKMPSVKVPKIKGPQVGVTLSKVEGDASLPKVEAEIPEGEVSVKVPEGEGSIEGGGMKIHMPKFKMPSMGFSKPDIKGPKVDVDAKAPKVEVTLPSTEVSISKPELKTGELAADISLSAPEVKMPADQASLELKTPDFQIQPPSAEIAVEGGEAKLEGVDGKFKMPKFQMPKFGISLPKGKAAVEGEITVPSIEAEIPTAELKGEVTVPSLETGIKVSGPQIEAPSMQVEVGEKGKIKMPDVKMPSVKVPKIKGPQVGVTLSKVEGDASLPKVEAEIPEAEVSIKVPEAEGSIEGGGMKIHMPKFKMPSMGFSKPDIKGPKVDVDAKAPKVEVTLPSAEVSISKPELKTGELAADISLSAPEVKMPADQASLELKTPDFQIQPPSAEIAVEGGEAKLEGVDGKFKMPKFQMPKFGISLPKGKAAVEGEITVPSVEVEIPIAELKGEVTVPSLETGIKVSGPETEAPSVQVEVGEKGKIKMPDVKMPSVKVPKIKGPQVGVTLSKVEGDASLPKVEAEIPEGEVSVKVPEAEGSIEGGGMKIHMPKFKMPSMGFSKPDIKGPKVDVDAKAPKVEVTLPSAEVSISKPELKTGQLAADISLSAPEVKMPADQASLELKTPDFQIQPPSAEIAVEGGEAKLEGVDGKFKMPKFQMPKFGISLPKGKAAVEREITVPSVEVEIPIAELKGEVTVPSLETGIKVSGPETEAPSVQVEVGEKGKIKMPDVKMPSVKVPKIKGPQVGVTLSKVEGDASLPKVEAEIPEGEVSVKVPEAEGSIEGGGMKIHMPKFKMPSMGFSKPDIKGPKVDVDAKAPKVEVTLPSAEVSISKPELKTGELAADISLSAPEVKMPADQASLELKTPDFQIQPPSAEIAVEGGEAKLEGVDGKFKMPKFQMPKFGISLPKGKAAVEGEITVPSVEAEIPTAELKGEVTVPSLETGIKVSGPQIEAPSMQVEVGEKGKIKMPDVKMPSVKVPKIKGPQVGVTLSKVEGDASLPKVEAEIPEAEVSVKVPEAEGSIEGGGMKIHMPKFKMPSMGFSKGDIKGPKVDVDAKAPKIDVTLPSAEVSISKPELKTGELAADISLSAPEVKMPVDQASLELKTPDFQIQPPSAEIAVEGGEAKLEGVDGKFKMPKFQMPKFGISLPKGKAAVEGEITAPSIEAEIPAAELKGEVTVPSLETGIKVSGPQIEAPSVQVEVGEKGKIKMPDVKMPSVKVPKIKGPQVGVTFSKVEGDASLPKVEAEIPEAEVSVKVPEAEGSIEGGGMKIHMPKFKMPSMGFSKPDIKGPKVDVDAKAPKVEVTLPSAEVSISKPELKTGELAADISLSAPEVKMPADQASLELKTLDFQIQPPSAEIAVEGGEAKLEGVDGKFKMPKFQMPKFGISLPKGKAAVEREITVPSVEVEIPTAELKGEVTVPSLETGIKVSGPETEAPSVQVEVGEKGKIKMPDVKMPSVKVPKIKGPQVGITLSKVEGDASLPKVEAEIPEGEVSVKVPEAEGSIEGGGMKIHMPKFKMPSMGFSKGDIKGPKVDVDAKPPKIDVTLPSDEVSISKPELKTGELAADISPSAPEVKMPADQASLELKTPDFQIQPPSAEIAVEGGEAKLEGVDGKFKMPKFQMPKFGISLPKGKAAVEGEITVPSVEVEIPTAELKGEVTVPSLETGIKVSGPETEAPSVQVEVGEKGKIKMPDVKMPSVKVPKIKGPQVGVTLSKVEGDASLPKVEAEIPEGEVSVKVPEAEGSIEGGGMKIHMPKFKMPSMGFSKQDIKGPKVDVDAKAPKVDVTFPSAEVSISKPELKTGELAADISLSTPEVKMPADQASLELKTPDFQIQQPSAEIAVESGEAKLEGVDGKFKMPKFQMPKFGISLPKGKAAAEGEITVPSVEAEIPTAELKGEVTVPSLETGIKVSGPQTEAPSVQVEVGEKGKIKMPDVKMPSVKVPKIKGPQVGVTLSKVEGDASLPKVEAEIPEGEASVKVPKAEGSMEGGGMKIHMPKFKMPSMGFSKPDIKGPDVDVDAKAPKVDVTLPSAEVSISKPELKTGELAADISLSAPEVKMPADQASLELKTPDFQIQPPSAEIAVEGGEAKLEGVDGKFKMPKFQMPEFGISLPKGKAVVEGEITVPSVEAEIPTAELKGEVTVPSLETGIKVSGPQIGAPSVQVEVGEKGKIKMPDVKMPSVKVPKIKGPQVGVTLSKVEGDASLPKVEAEIPEGEVSVRVPEAEGSIEGGGMKIHMPKFKMPSMGFSKPDIKGPKVDVDAKAPKVDVTLPSAEVSISKPELKTGELAADISLSTPEVKMPADQAALELKTPDFQIQPPSAEISVEGGEAKLEGVDGKFKMPKFQMPKFGISLPKGKAAVEGEITVPSVEAEIPTADLKGEVTVPSLETGIKVSGPQIEAPSVQVEVGEKGKIKMPDVKMPSVKVPKIKGPQVGVTLSKVEGDASLPKVEAEIPEAEVSVKVPEAEGSMEGGGMKIHMPKFKMPSMGFSTPDIRGPKVDVDAKAPKVDVTLPSAEVSISKPELKTGELAADISLSAPEVKMPADQASLELKTPDFQIQPPSAEISVEGGEAKLEGVDGKFKMPKFQMPKFGISLPKGKAAVEGQITVPSVEAEIPTAELKGEVTVPSLETGIKVLGPQIEAPSVQVEVGEKGKIKMPDVKMPSVKVPKIKGPQVGVTLSKVDGDASLPKVEADIPERQVSVRVPEAEGSIEGGGMKILMPKFKMPSMGFSKPDIKGPKVDVDAKAPKVEVTLPSAEVSISKPELKTGALAADISLSAPEVKMPADQAAWELKTPDFQIQPPSAEIAVDGGEAKLEGVDGKFKMPKLQMPKFGISLPKGKAAVEGEITVPSVEAEIPTAELKAEVTVPSLETGIKVSGPQIEAPSVQVEVGEKGKIKMPDVKMPSVKVPKIKGPQVGVTLSKVEGDASLPKVEAEIPEGEVSVRVPEAEGSIEGGGMKIHMPKFKMPSMGFSKPDIKGPKVDVDAKAPKVDVTLPSAEVSISKPELKTGELAADIGLSAPEVKMPADQASLELKTPDFQIQPPSAEIAVEGGEAKLEGVDGKFKMPKFQMPKFGISLPKGKAAVEGQITVPSVEAEIPTAELKGEVTVPSLETGIKVSGPQIEAPSVQVEVGEKGKIKMPDVKMPSVKVPKIKGPQVGVTLSKVEGDASLPKVEAEIPEGEVSVRVPEAEGSIEGGGMKIHMPKFKMPSMGFSKPDIKGPKVDVDAKAPKVEVTLPSAEVSISNPELKTGELAADISLSAPEVKMPADQAALELKTLDFQIQPPSAEIAVEGGEAKLQGVEGKFKMPKFQMPKFGISLPKGKAAVEGQITVPSVEAEIPTAELKGEVTVPSLETGIKVSGPQIEAPSVQVEVGEKGKIKMPDVKMPSVKVPKIKGPQVGVTLSKVEGDASLPKVEAELPEAEVSVRVPEAEGSIEGGGMKIHMPKFKMPSMGFSKPDIKGPKIDVDAKAPKVDVTLPSAEVNISKPELKTGELAADISLSAPEVKMPADQAFLELKTPDFQIQPPSAEIAVEGGEAKLEGVDGKFKMPKFQMPKFGISLPKGKAAVEGEITVPSVEVEIPIAELKGEVTVPSLETGIKLSRPQIEALSVQVEGGEKDKIKIPDVKMPSVTVPKIKGPQVGVTLSKVEGDASLPKVEAEIPEGEVSVKVPEAEGSIERGGMKMHMPKFKMPSMGFSRQKLKRPEIDVNISAPNVDITLPSAEVSISKPELKTGELESDVSLSAPEVKIPAEQASLEVTAPDVQIQPPSADITLESGKGMDGKFKMPKFQMPKFGISLPKGKAAVEGEITLPSVAVEIPTAELKADVTVPSLETGIKVSGPQIETPSMQMEIGEKGKIKMPDVKMPSVTVPKIKGPQVGVTLSKVDGDPSPRKVEAELPEAEVSVKVPEAEGSIEGGGMKIHMPKFKMPSMGFSKPDIKVPKVNVDAKAPKVDVTLPSAEVSISKPELETGELADDISLSAPEVKMPAEQASLELKAPDFQIQPPSAEIAVEGGEAKLEVVDGKFKMPKFQMPKFGISLPKGKAGVEGEITVPSVEAEIPTAELKGEVTVPSLETGIKVSGPQIEAPSVQVETGEKVPEISTEFFSSDTDFSAAEITVDGSKGKMKMPKFHIPKFGLSRTKDKMVESKIVASKADVDIPGIDTDVQILDIRTIEPPEIETDVSDPKSHTLSAIVLQRPKTDIQISGIDVPIPSVDVFVPKTEVNVQGPDLDFKELKMEASEKDTTEKENKFKMPKFKLPSFNWSPKKEASISGHVDASLEDPSLTISESEKEPELSLTGEYIDDGIVELDSHVSIDKDSERSKFRRPQFSMPKLSLPKMKGHKAEMSVSQLQSDLTVSEQEDQGDGTLHIPEKEVSGDDAKKSIKMPKVKLPSLELSKPEIKAPHVDMEVSLPKSDVHLPTSDDSLSKPGLKLGDIGVDVSTAASETKVSLAEDLKGREVKMEGRSAEISLDGAEIKVEGVEGKMKKPKFQMPRFGISFSKGKVPDTEVSLLSVEAEVPQLKTTTDIADIAVEASTLEAEYAAAGGEPIVVDEKIKIPPVPKAAQKTPALDIKLPSVGLSMPLSEKDFQNLEAISKEDKPEGDLKTEVLDTEEKEGHFKMPKFKLPSFNWSPKKEGSLKTDIKEPLEKPTITLPEETDAELTVVISEDQGVQMDLDAEMTSKKGQVKRPHFAMPKVSLSKPKLPKSQAGLSKVETDITEEREGELVQIPDIESSFTTGDKEATEISIKMPKGISKPEIKAPKIDIDAKVSTADIKVPLTGCSFELKSSERGFEGTSAEVDMDTAGRESDGLEIKLPKLQMPKFGISVSEGEVPKSEIVIPVMTAEMSKVQVTTERLDEEAPVLEVRADTADVEMKGSSVKIKVPQMPTAETKASDTSVYNEKDLDIQGEREVQTEGSQGWFKMPKFRMPSFGRSSLKGKKSEAEDESDVRKVPTADMQVEIKTLETAAQSLHVDESCSGKDSLEGKVTFPSVAIPEDGVSIQTETGSDQGSLLQPSGKIDIKLSVEGSKTYADVVKHGADEQLQKPPFSSPRGELSSEISISKVDATLPKCGTALQHKAKPDSTLSVGYSVETKRLDMGTDVTASTEITVDGTERRIDMADPKEEVIMQSRDAVAKAEKGSSETKSPKKDSQGKESVFKRPKFSMPSFGWSTPKSAGHIAEDLPNLEEPEAALPEIKMDASITDEDFEIIELPVEGFEKDTSTEVEVKAEERDRSSKTKGSKFKMPKFGSLRTKSRDSETHADPLKIQTEGSLAETEGGTLEIQIQKREGSVDLKSTKLDTVDKESEDSELNFHIPKLRMPKFTHSTPTAEGQVLSLEGTTDGKCADTDGEPLLELGTDVLEEKADHTGDDIQKSKVRITTLSEPAVQRTKVESKVPSKESVFAETAVHIQRPVEFGTSFPKEQIDTMGSTIHKSIAKITTLTEPDIQITQLEIKHPSADPFTPDASVHVQGPHGESKEMMIESTPVLSYGSESQETFSTQIVRESEIPPSEIKTATYGFSLLKLKMQEPHLSVGVPVKCSSVEDMNETSESKDFQPKFSVESSGITTQKTVSVEFKVSGKDQGIAGGFTEGASSTTALTNLKPFTVEVKSSSEFADKQPKELSVSAVSKDNEETNASRPGEEPTEQKEYSDSRSSSGRFKFWFPTIGFSSSVDDTTTDSKAEDQTSFPEEMQPKDPSATDSDSAKQTGWFRFPKLGFSSPTKKVKEVDKEEETDPKKRKPQGEESPTEKTEMFFDAQETLPPKEIVAETEEISGTTPLAAIVSSSARTELILLEKEKAASQNIPEEPSK